MACRNRAGPAPKRRSQNSYFFVDLFGQGRQRDVRGAVPWRTTSPSRPCESIAVNVVMAHIVTAHIVMAPSRPFAPSKRARARARVRARTTALHCGPKQACACLCVYDSAAHWLEGETSHW